MRQRERAARQIDDLSYRLRLGLPHPLAYRWRQAETAQSTLEGYRDVLECAETCVCYLAFTAVIMMREMGVEVSYLAEMADRLTNRGHVAQILGIGWLFYAKCERKRASVRWRMCHFTRCSGF